MFVVDRKQFSEITTVCDHNNVKWFNLLKSRVYR